MSLLKIEKLSKRFGDLWAVRDAEFTVEKGEIFGLVGASGSGKTTILRMIAGIETPSLGKILLEDTDITTVAPEKRNFGAVFQDFGLYPRYDVFENVAFGLKTKKLSKAQTKEKVDKALKLVKLAGYEKQKTGSLSTSEQQRVALARTIAGEPKVLLFDEPLSNSDAHLREEMRDELREFIKTHDLTAVYVTHNQDEAFAFCDRIAVLNKGEIFQIGTPKDVYESPENATVAKFFGRNNLIEARRLSKSTDNYQEFHTIIGEHRLFADTDKKSKLGAINQNVFLAIRPENLSITFGAAFPEDNLLKATIKAVNYQGATTRVTLDCKGLSLEALVLRLIGLQIGDECLVGLPPNRLSILKS